MKRIIQVVFSILLLTLVSCGPEEIIFDPASDAFLVVKTIDNNNQIDTVYGLALHVFANKGIQSVQATPNDGSGISYELSAFDGYPYDFFYQTPDDEFSTTMPFVGDYSFDIIAQSDETATMSDRLLDDVIYPTDTLESSYDNQTSGTVLTWNKIEDADYIVIKMFDTSKNLMFNSSAIKGTKTEFAFGTSTAGWSGSFPSSGTNYLVEMDAYMYEPGQTGVNIQAKSINFKNITWGE